MLLRSLAYYNRVSQSTVSLGAIDFGLIVDGSVVMMENIPKVLRADTPVLELVRQGGREVARPVFFAV